MTTKTKKSTHSSKETKILTDTISAEAIVAQVHVPRTVDDAKTAMLAVSVLINVFIFTSWLTLQVTTQFDSQVASFLFNR